MNSSLLRQLQAVDWDFPRQDRESSSAIHWYPGTFPSQLPSTVIEALASENSIVFDPYGGIGTTSIEALRRGNKAWTVDQNPIACLAAYVMGGLVLLKSLESSLPSNCLSSVEDLVGLSHKGGELFSVYKSIDFDSHLERLIKPRPDEFLHAYAASAGPNFKFLAPWFERDTLSAIGSTYGRIIESNNTSFEKLVSLLMLSACLRPASSQTRSWGHIADNVYPDVYVRKNIRELMLRWLRRLYGTVDRIKCAELPNRDRRGTRLWVARHDWTSQQSPSIKPRTGCELLVTSPPYAGAIDYTRAQRLSLYVLGCTETDINALGASEIGARRKRFNSLSEATWADELALSIRTQLHSVSEDGTVVLVLPHVGHGREGGSMSMGQSLSDAGWTRKYCVDRSIRQARTRQSWTSIKRETIEFFQR